MSRSGEGWSEGELHRILRQPGYGLVNGGRISALVEDPREHTFLSEVRRLAKTHGWIPYHTHDSRHSDSGFPDLVLARPATATSPGRLIFAELKRAKTKTTQDQETWLSVLAHTVPGVEVYLWRPGDLGTIAEILTARIGRTDAPSLT